MRVSRRPLSKLLPTALAVALATAAASSAPATVLITVDRPGDGDVLASPVTVAASATTDIANASLTAWQVFLDGVSVYSTAGGNAISTKVPMANGDHELILRATDSTGDTSTQTLTVTAGTCEGFTVEMQAPQAGTVETPVQFSAVAASCHRITRFAAYADGQEIFRQNGSRSVNTPLDLPVGTHTVLIKAWDATGASVSSDAVPIEVVAPPKPKTPARQNPKPPAQQPPAASQPPPAPQQQQPAPAPPPSR